MERKELGRIQSAEFGFGGYQDAEIGVSFTLGGAAWGVCDFWGAWAIERSEHSEWSESDRIKHLGEAVMHLNEVLSEAKVQTVANLKGVPIEAIFNGNRMISWRVLTEVL